MNGYREFANTGTAESTRRSTEDGCTHPSSNGSISIRPAAISLRMSTSEDHPIGASSAPAARRPGGRVARLRSCSAAGRATQGFNGSKPPSLKRGFDSPRPLDRITRARPRRGRPAPSDTARRAGSPRSAGVPALQTRCPSSIRPTCSGVLSGRPRRPRAAAGAFGGGLRDEPEPRRDAVDVRVDRDRLPAEREGHHDGDGLRADPGSESR